MATHLRFRGYDVAATRRFAATQPGASNFQGHVTHHHPAPESNRLLQALPAAEQEHFIGACVEVQFERGQVLYEAGDALLHVHFPTSTYVSIVSAVEGRTELRAAMIGNEGAFGYELAFDVDCAPHQVQVQGAGKAWRMTAQILKVELAASPTLRRLLNRYLCLLLTQSVRMGACSYLHLLEARLAHWLLSMQDRAGSPRLVLTHEALAGMLGVRRAGITNASAALVMRNLIGSHRGIITIVDRPGLKAVACGCYQANRLVYETMAG
ncbi:MAG: Crp/Fnr family transcriptional regulator [Burkholderiales bacterium]